MSERYGDYELLRLIATGGMAEIYLARHDGVAGLSRMVVVKRMLPQLAVRPDFVRMFLDEARLAAKLNHPNIVQVFNLGEVDHSYYIAMEFVDGPHLGALFAHSLRQRAALPVELCVQTVARAADGLHYAHEVNDPETDTPLSIVHRDISPQNLLVSRHGDVKVTDFGVAKASNQQTKTRTGIIKGKVAYMSPEQCLGEAVDRRTDVFALGIVLYELLTRRRLFREKSDLLIMQRITTETVAAPSTINKEIDAELDAICAKALARKREERFSSASDFAEALDSWLATHFRGDPRLHLQRWFEQHAGELVVSTRDELSSPEGATARLKNAPATSPGEATSATPSLNSAETVMSSPERRLPVRGAAPAETTQRRADPRTESSAEVDQTGEPPPDGESEAAAIEEEQQTVSLPRDAVLAALQPPAKEESEPVVLPRSNRLLPIAAGVAAALVLGVVSVMLATGGGEQAGSAVVVDAGGGGDVPSPPDPAPPHQAVAKVRVETEPPGVAILSDDDRVVGKSPVTFEHQAGPMKVTAQFPDQSPVALEVTLEPGEERTLRLLAKVPLEIKSAPARAKVRVAGVLKGETPFKERALITPEQDVEVRLELDGYEPITRVLHAVAGQGVRLDETLAAATKRRPPDPVRPRTADPGFLNMRSTPWVNVRLQGGGSLGATIFTNQKVPSGRQTLVLSNPELGLSDSLQVVIPEGKALSVILEWEKRPSGGWRIKTKTIR
ncbi:MAG: serine/threonine protein kinase [Deltaproteobacteria bacterium]|nr:serine/threonine protein kinase [Deltaproteobacteria bacterium]